MDAGELTSFLVLVLTTFVSTIIFIAWFRTTGRGRRE